MIKRKYTSDYITHSLFPSLSRKRGKSMQEWYTLPLSRERGAGVSTLRDINKFIGIKVTNLI